MKQSSLKFYAKFLDEQIKKGLKMNTNEFSMAPLEKLRPPYKEGGNSCKDVLMHIQSVLENSGTDKDSKNQAGKFACNDNNNGKKCEVLEGYQWSMQSTLDVLKDAVKAGKVIRARDFAMVPFDQKQLGQFQYLLFLLPVIKCFDLSEFGIDAKGFYEAAIEAKTDGEVLVISKEFHAKTGIDMFFDTPDTWLGTLKINYQVQEVDDILKLIEKHNFRNIFKEKFLVFKMELKSIFKLKTLLVTKMRNYSLKSILFYKNCYVFDNQEVIHLDFDAEAAEKLDKFSINEFPKNQVALRGDDLHLIFERNDPTK
jgi:hypothetical protein